MGLGSVPRAGANQFGPGEPKDAEGARRLTSRRATVFVGGALFCLQPTVAGVLSPSRSGLALVGGSRCQNAAGSIVWKTWSRWGHQQVSVKGRLGCVSSGNCCLL